MGIEEHVAVRRPCCDAVEVYTRHARICHRAGAQVTLSMLGVLLYVSHSPARCITCMVGRFVYADSILVLGETVTTTTDRRQRWARLHSLSPRSSDIIQHEGPSKDHHEFCLPRLAA